MSRSLLLATLGLLLHAIVAALAVALGWDALPVAPAVVLVAYAALAEPPIEAAISATLLGFMLDALSGSPIGMNMLACLLALLVGRLAAGAVAAPRGLGAFVFGGGMSMGYHLFLLIVLLMFGGERESFGLLSILSTGLFDGLVALVLMPATQALFIALGLEQREVTMTERLTHGARTANLRRQRAGMKG
jgi:rod shape-determining protein MreD